MTTENIFAKMAQEGAETSPATPVPPVAPAQTSAEYSPDQFSDKAVGDAKKYIRPNLGGQKQKIKSFQVFKPDLTEEPIKAISNPNVQYWKCNCIITYDSKNAEGVDNREYLSGAIAFKQRDGSMSEPSFYNEDAENQVANLWRLVAKLKNIEPLKMSKREFVSTLNSGIYVELEDVEIKFKGEKTHKNLPKSLSRE